MYLGLRITFGGCYKLRIYDGSTPREFSHKQPQPAHRLARRKVNPHFYPKFLLLSRCQFQVLAQSGAKSVLDMIYRLPPPVAAGIIAASRRCRNIAATDDSPEKEFQGR